MMVLSYTIRVICFSVLCYGRSLQSSTMTIFILELFQKM